MSESYPLRRRLSVLFLRARLQAERLWRAVRTWLFVHGYVASGGMRVRRK